MFHRRHNSPGEPRHTHLRGHPGDGDPLHGPALQEAQTQGLQEQGAGTLGRPAREQQGQSFSSFHLFFKNYYHLKLNAEQSPK